MGVIFAFISVLLSASINVGAQSCGGALKNGLELADGFSASVLKNGISSPRGIIFDTLGNLLVVQSGRGIVGLKLEEDSKGCVKAAATGTVISSSGLNHGIELSSDGKTLYASDSDKAYMWSYDPRTMKATGTPTTIIQGMSGFMHTTRTLLMSKKFPGTLLASRGSAGNVDSLAADRSSGHSQIRAFNVSSRTQNFARDGIMVAMGLRNSVGVAEHPVTGGLWSVENSMDNLRRDGRDVHTDNPGEELNYMGSLADPKSLGKNYGYPACYAAWNLQGFPQAASLKVGSQFAINNLNANNNDEMCARNYVPPRLTFPAHWAPLDIKFNSQGTVAYITSHGSWNRSPADGYLLFAIAFANGEPKQPSTSTTAVIPIMKSNMRTCPRGCFRPVGLAFDSKGRLFMSSDTTGEIYVITRKDGKNVDSVTF